MMVLLRNDSFVPISASAVISLGQTRANVECCELNIGAQTAEHISITVKLLKEGHGWDTPESDLIIIIIYYAVISLGQTRANVKCCELNIGAQTAEHICEYMFRSSCYSYWEKEAKFKRIGLWALSDPEKSQNYGVSLRVLCQQQQRVAPITWETLTSTVARFDTLRPFQLNLRHGNPEKDLQLQHQLLHPILVFSAVISLGQTQANVECCELNISAQTAEHIALCKVRGEIDVELRDEANATDPYKPSQTTAHTLRKDRNEIIKGIENKDPYQILQVLKALEGTKHIFQFRFGHGGTKDRPDFILDKAMDDEPLLLPATPPTVENTTASSTPPAKEESTSGKTE
ncbi:hypothetical protein Tco_1237184 [Tanacetum coccineum]